MMVCPPWPSIAVIVIPFSPFVSLSPVLSLSLLFFQPFR